MRYNHTNKAKKLIAKAQKKQKHTHDFWYCHEWWCHMSSGISVVLYLFIIFKTLMGGCKI